MEGIQGIQEKIKKKNDELSDDKKKEITLLTNQDVLKWIYDDKSFMKYNDEQEIIGYCQTEIEVDTGTFYKQGPRKGNVKYKKKKIDNKNKPKYKYSKANYNKMRKVEEDEWCKQVMKVKRPDLVDPEKKQSKFGPLGEELCKEFYTLSGDEPFKPSKKVGKSYTLDLETSSTIIESKAGSYLTGGTAGEKIYGVPRKYMEVPRLYGKPLLIICIGGSEKFSRDKCLIGDCDIPESKLFADLYEKLNIRYVGFTELINNL